MNNTLSLPSSQSLFPSRPPEQHKKDLVLSPTKTSALLLAPLSTPLSQKTPHPLLPFQNHPSFKPNKPSTPTKTMCHLNPNSRPCPPTCPPHCSALHPAPSWTTPCSSPTCPTALAFASLPRLTRLHIQHHNAQLANAHALRLLTSTHRARIRLSTHRLLDLQARHGADALEIDAHRQEQCVANAAFESEMRDELRIKAALECVREGELRRIGELGVEEFEEEMGRRMADAEFFEEVVGFGLGDGGVVDGGEDWGEMRLGMGKRGRERGVGDGREEGLCGGRGGAGTGTELCGDGWEPAAKGRRVDDVGAWEKFREKARALPWEEVRCELDRHLCSLYFSTEPLVGTAEE
ncbi:hypothetical protein MMC11_007096 [Xylographa trunciseda]|nr:hypothetical protein [Xylographa trunciseda]